MTRAYTSLGLKNMFLNFRYNRQKQSRRNETKPCFLFTLRHRYTKVSHAAGNPLTNITVSMGHTTVMHHQSYARFIPDGTADLYAKRNARVA